MQTEGDVELSVSDLPVVRLADYLENASLLSAVDISEDEEEDNNKIALMTVHSSKGLEFPYVYVVGMEENIFPSGGWMASETEVEEERRLFYVAMTRAKKVLECSFATTRMRHGKHESNSPSRFLREIDARYISNPSVMASGEDEQQPERSSGGWSSHNTYGRSGAVRTEPKMVHKADPATREARPVSSVSPTPFRRLQSVPKRVPDAEFEPTPILKLRAGQRIEHNRFGFGMITEITGNVTDLKAKIAFDEHGEKILILKYAKIRVIDLESN